MPAKALISRLFVCFLSASVTVAAPSGAQQMPDRVRLSLDTAEAGAVLAILARRDSGNSVTETDWQRLFATSGYMRLKAREAAMGRAFTDDDFKKFVLSDSLRGRRDALRRALSDWAAADMRDAANRA